MRFKPTKWIAAFLGLFVQVWGMLYVGRPGLAITYFAASALVFLAEWFVHPYFVLTMFGLAATCSAHAFRLARNYDDTAARRWYTQWYGMAWLA